MAKALLALLLLSLCSWAPPGPLLASHAVLQARGHELDVFVVDAGVVVALHGQVLLAGEPRILDSLPGGQHASTAGTTGCFVYIPPFGGAPSMHTMTVTGTGPSLGAAVQDFKAKIADLAAMGFHQVPCGASEAAYRDPILMHSIVTVPMVLDEMP
jgi:hypothetical protein